jgi:RND superfamily putative drug exporter
VGAALGLVVLVFQLGWGNAFFGVARPLSTVPMMVPLLVFCLTFGLSMDYEVFMLARVREARLDGLDEEAAIAHGLGATGSGITAAAALMVLVFSSFVGADIVLVKMLGFGLAVAIALDATVIRLVLAPALLAIAGRWNWWPGYRAASSPSSKDRSA